MNGHQHGSLATFAWIGSSESTKINTQSSNQHVFDGQTDFPRLGHVNMCIFGNNRK